MIGRLDKLWFGVLEMAHHWIVRQVTAHCLRESMREPEGDCGCEMMRLERALACQRPDLN